MACTITSVTLATSTSVTINYTAYTGGVTFTRYGAQWSDNNGTNWYPATPTYFSSGTTVTPITYSALTIGSTYLFRVSAYNVSTIVGGSSSDGFGPVTMVATPTSAPATSVVAANGVIKLTLASALTGATKYRIQRDIGTAFTNPVSTDISVMLAYTDDGTPSNMAFGAKGTTYYYRYCGVAANGTPGVYSAVSAAAVYATVPDAPTNLALGTIRQELLL
jgi:hypothetical protein